MGERKRAGSQKKKCQCEVHEFIDIRRTSKPMNSMKRNSKK